MLLQCKSATEWLHWGSAHVSCLPTCGHAHVETLVVSKHAEAKMIECRNDVYLRAWQVCVCPGCEGKGIRECPNCYGAGVNTAG